MSTTLKEDLPLMPQNALTEGWGGVFALSLPWPGARVPSVEHPQELSWKVS